MAYLRRKGFSVGPLEGAAALELIAAHDPLDAHIARLGLRAILCGDRDQWVQFDTHFDGYWYGREIKLAGQLGRRDLPSSALWDRHLSGGSQVQPSEQTPGEPTGAKASRRDSLARIDLRKLVDTDNAAAAERLAERLARAIRIRLIRRSKAARRGRRIDFRRTIRRSLPRGGEPIDVIRRRRPHRPARLVVLLDVSGSMKPYSRAFLAFLYGLLGPGLGCEAFVFHTRLLRVTDLLRTRDPARGLDRLSLMAQGFGGGTRIAHAVEQLNEHYGHKVLTGRSVVVVLSDGYDTDAPDRLTRALGRLRRRSRRLVWLNPLIAQPGYAPRAGGMAAALAYVDLFAPAHDLTSLAALETEFQRL